MVVVRWAALDYYVGCAGSLTFFSIRNGNDSVELSSGLHASSNMSPPNRCEIAIYQFGLTMFARCDVELIRCGDAQSSWPTKLALGAVFCQFGRKKTCRQTGRLLDTFEPG